MKNRTLILLALTSTLGFMAFGLMDWKIAGAHSPGAVECQPAPEPKQIAVPAPDFAYDLGTRFSPVKKSALQGATSIFDFLTEEQVAQVESYKSVSIVIIENDILTDIRETAPNPTLSEGQKRLLQSSDYSTNFLVRVDYAGINLQNGVLEDNYFSPHLTIVPEKQAAYEFGEDAFVKYLSENNLENTLNIDEKILKPAKLYFDVGKDGSIRNVRIVRSCGYPTVDAAMVRLLQDAPGSWAPAENAKGDKVEQELVVSYGLMGC